MTYQDFPPSGEQCEGPQPFGGDGPCEAALTIANPPSADAGPDIGRSVLCWTAATSGPWESSITPGSCDGKDGCEFNLVLGLNIEPAGAHEECPHYDFWHGEGEWEKKQAAEADGKPYEGTNDPKWAIGSDLGKGAVQWGPTSANPPNGDSRPRITIRASLKCGEGPKTVTIIAIPAGGSVAQAVEMKITLNCADCP